METYRIKVSLIAGETGRGIARCVCVGGRSRTIDTNRTFWELLRELKHGISPEIAPRAKR